MILPGLPQVARSEMRLCVSICSLVMLHCTYKRAHLYKDYFGEKIGLYFVWLGHYTLWLISAAFVGWICWISVAAEGNDPDAPSIP